MKIIRYSILMVVTLMNMVAEGKLSLSMAKDIFLNEFQCKGIYPITDRRICWPDHKPVLDSDGIPILLSESVFNSFGNYSLA